MTSSIAWILLADGTKQSLVLPGSVNIMNKEYMYPVSLIL